jgi:hypothetical protein
MAPMMGWLDDRTTLRRRGVVWGLLLALSLVVGACGDDDGDVGGGDGDGDSGGDGDAGVMTSCMPRDADDVPDAGSCVADADDYSPCADDAWPACVSDDGDYHRIEETISSIGRVAAFEEIAQRLFDATTDPSAEDFLAARMLYQEDEGLDSRVVRRYDPHYEPAEGTDCATPDGPVDEPDYCVGPARIQPVILDALNAGIMGEGKARVHAARVEAGLLWFLYVSTFKESKTCTDKAKDCDSSYAYYTGGADARGGLGLARYVMEVDPYAHDRAWDGLLAQRCWRDLDDGEVAMDLELRDRARSQTDRAVLHGVASIVIDRLQKLADASGDEAAYQHAFVQVLGGVLDREARERDADAADALATELEQDVETIDTDAAIAAIEAVFDCP